MALTTITIQNDNPSHTKIANVNVSLYTPSAVFVTSSTTDINGLITLNIPDGTYDCLFFKQGATFTQPQRIIIDSLVTNNFLITGHIKVMPESLDNTLCRVSGYINGVDGKPVADLDVRFNPLPLNMIVNSNLIFNDPIQATSDKKGYFEFDLLRGINYEASVEGYLYPLISKTANVPAVKVSDLLFPIPANISLSLSTLNTALSGGNNSSVSYTVTYTDFNTGKLANDWSSVEVNYSVNDIVKIGATDTNLVVTPLRTGTTVVTFVRVIKDLYIWVNPPVFTAQSLTINVL
jgi:hypothetical protein